MTSASYVISQIKVCSEGCCLLTWDQAIGLPEHRFNNSQVSRPMFQVLHDDYPSAGLPPENLYMENGKIVDDWTFE